MPKTISTHPDINYFIFGHRHIELDLMLSRTTRAIILGDWITEFSYAVFDGEHMLLEEFVEGETQPDLRSGPFSVPLS